MNYRWKYFLVAKKLCVSLFAFISSKVVVWSLEALFKGVWPTQDWNGRKWEKGSLDSQRAGKPLAQGFRACLVAVTGDLDYLTAFHGNFPKVYMVNLVCLYFLHLTWILSIAITQKLCAQDCQGLTFLERWKPIGGGNQQETVLCM